MGSLMAGWGSSALDPKSATLKRNRSLTKEEINAYWRSRREIEEEHLRAISNLSETTQASKYKDYSEKKLQKSHSMPVREKEPLDMDVGTSLEQLIKKNGWWTKSNWAFLNEPPVLTEAASKKYASQFHIANLGSTKLYSEDGINA